VPVANIALPAITPGRGSRFTSVSVASAKIAGEQQRQRRERQRAIELGDAIIESDQHGERCGTRLRRSTASAPARARNGLAPKSAGAEQHGQPAARIRCEP